MGFLCQDWGLEAVRVQEVSPVPCAVKTQNRPQAHGGARRQGIESIRKEHNHLERLADF